MRPNPLTHRPFKETLLIIIEDIYSTDFWGVCTQMAFYFLMAFFPLIIFLIHFVGSIVIQFEDFLFDFLKVYLPDLSYTYVVTLTEQLDANLNNNNYLLLIITFLFASMAARAIMIGIDQNYGIQTKRSMVRVWCMAFLITLLFGLSIILALLSYIVISNLGIRVLIILRLYALTDPFVRIFTFIFSTIALILIFDIIYTFAPTHKLSFSAGLPGAIFATLGVNFAMRIFALFANHSTRYTLLYGSLGGLFALLVGIYFICVILNLGGKINIYCQALSNENNENYNTP